MVNKQDLTNLKEELATLITTKFDELNSKLSARMEKLETAWGLVEDQQELKTLVTSANDLKQEIVIASTKVKDDMENVVSNLNDIVVKEQETAERWRTQTALKVLSNDVHNRKWCVIIHGIPGDAGEHDFDTYNIVRKTRRRQNGSA